MATASKIETLAFDAAGDLSDRVYHIMRISDGAQQVDIASQDTHGSMIGVLQNKPAASVRHAAVAFFGQGKVTAGAAINSAGLLFTTNGSGRAVAATSGDMVAGRILETANADGDVVAAMYYPPFRLSGSV